MIETREEAGLYRRLDEKDDASHVLLSIAFKSKFTRNPCHLLRAAREQ
jgi:hypothetical protein